jgi:hypothetical protein
LTIPTDAAKVDSGGDHAVARSEGETTVPIHICGDEIMMFLLLLSWIPGFGILRTRFAQWRGSKRCALPAEAHGAGHECEERSTG